MASKLSELLARQNPTKINWQKMFEINRREHNSLLPMEGLRGFSILMVFLVHYMIHSIPMLPQGSFTSSFARGFYNNAHTAVDMFFMLSGFFIYGALIARPRSPWRFYARRAERVYPPFLVMLGIYLALSYLVPSESKLPDDRLQALLYLIANLFFLPGLFPIPPLISVTWTMSYEIFFYVTIPLLILALRLHAWHVKLRWAFHLALAAITMTFFNYWGGHVRMIMFVSGMLLHDLLASQVKLKIAPGVGIATLVIAFSLMFFLPFDVIGLNIRALALFFLLPLTALDCLLNSRGLTAKIFSWTPLRWMGNMSYSYYLMHGLVLKGLFYIYHHLLGQSTLAPEAFWLCILPGFFATLAASIPLYWFIEYPFSLVPKRFRTLPMRMSG